MNVVSCCSSWTIVATQHPRCCLRIRPPNVRWWSAMTFLLIYTIWNASSSQTKPISWQCSYCCCCSISHYYLLQLFSIWGFSVSFCTFWNNVILMLEPPSSLGPIGKESVASMAATIKICQRKTGEDYGGSILCFCCCNKTSVYF